MLMSLKAMELKNHLFLECRENKEGMRMVLQPLRFRGWEEEEPSMNSVEESGKSIAQYSGIWGAK